MNTVVGQRVRVFVSCGGLGTEIIAMAVILVRCEKTSVCIRKANETSVFIYIFTCVYIFLYLTISNKNIMMLSNNNNISPNKREKERRIIFSDMKITVGQGRGGGLIYYCY